MAEREGFEPSIPVKACPLSRRIVSTAHAPLRNVTSSYQLRVSSSQSARAFNSRLISWASISDQSRELAPTKLLAAAPEEFLQNLGAPARHNPATNLDFVVQP